MTLVAFGVHGYHPYAEDGGVYMAGIKRLLRPELYAASAPFVDAHLRFSLFAPAMASFVEFTHGSLERILLVVHILSLWTTLFGMWLIAAQCRATRSARAGAVVLLSLWLTLPVAGTSLILMDPYVTARSLSLPCTVLALGGTIALRCAADTRHRVWGAIIAAVALVLAALMHPLMAGYGLAAVLLLACLLSPRKDVRQGGTLTLCLAAVVFAALLQRDTSPAPAAYLPIALSRYYWFLSRWHGYEIAGLIAPIAILAIVAHRSAPGSTVCALARMAVLAGATGIAIALLFAHAGAPTHLVARLQPLRIFQLVYLVMILVLGSLLGERILKERPWRWLVAIVLFGAIFFAAQRDLYPHTAHIEWPGSLPRNLWEESFVWISRHAPMDALFALDADYIASPGEDAQCFRAIAERSALADYSKDGGEASITPSLTPLWIQGQQAQRDLSTRSDAERLAALRPLNVTWVVLQRQAKTAFECPFRNAAVQVCRLP